MEYQEFYEEMIQQRGISEVCTECRGYGVKMYGSTATWRRGCIAGQAMTRGICDKCWGSGDQSNPWIDLRAYENERRAKKEQPK